jgi:hypothetical protein
MVDAAAAAPRAGMNPWLKAALIALGIVTLTALALGVGAYFWVKSHYMYYELYQGLEKEPRRPEKVKFTAEDSQAVEAKIWIYSKQSARVEAAEPPPMELDEKEVNIFLQNRVADPQYELGWLKDARFYLEGDSIRLIAAIEVNEDLPGGLKRYIDETMPDFVKSRINERPWLNLNLLGSPVVDGDKASFQFREGTIGPRRLKPEMVNELGDELLRDLQSKKNKTGEGLNCLHNMRMENGKLVTGMKREETEAWVKKYGRDRPLGATPPGKIERTPLPLTPPVKHEPGKEPGKGGDIF